MNKRGFETLLYGITANTVAKISEMNRWSEDEAFERFTLSKLYEALEKEESKVWQYSSLMLAQLFNEEQNGNLSFPEI